MPNEAADSGYERGYGSALRDVLVLLRKDDEQLAKGLASLKVRGERNRERHATMKIIRDYIKQTVEQVEMLADKEVEAVLNGKG